MGGVVWALLRDWVIIKLRSQMRCQNKSLSRSALCIVCTRYSVSCVSGTVCHVYTGCRVYPVQCVMCIRYSASCIPGTVCRVYPVQCVVCTRHSVPCVPGTVCRVYPVQCVVCIAIALGERRACKMKFYSYLYV